MDFSKFSDSDFEVKEWVNKALSVHKDTQTPLDVSNSIVYVILGQLYCTGTCFNSGDEATALYSRSEQCIGRYQLHHAAESAKVMTGCCVHWSGHHDCVRRVLRDVEAVRQEATLLREQMQIVKEDIKKVWQGVWLGHCVHYSFCR